ncbi:hypothetical protein [Cupriavidus sp. UGS-1]|uniref:hypothetical protein n=1 Tax=Cupriavidus sp. UGS-1 TaxID=2899826 RepID=UPI001E4A2EBA|nr:hypothetical protein [Cupriavidus sp. UGS-1]MCD9120889.1 hypothetical protein [Cupriavidus sp. UGS-1]
MLTIAQIVAVYGVSAVSLRRDCTGRSWCATRRKWWSTRILGASSKMISHQKSEVLIASDVDYEQLIAEIYCDGRFVALLSRDKGPDHLEVVFPGPQANEAAITRSVELDWSKDALNCAKALLLSGADPVSPDAASH